MGQLLQGNLKDKYSVIQKNKANDVWLLQTKQNNKNKSNIVRRKNNLQYGQLENIKVDKDFKKNIQISQYRYNGRNQFIVNVLGIYESINPNQQPYFCSKSSSLCIITQRIPYRLSDLGQLQFIHAIYVMKCIIKGAALLEKDLNLVTIYDQNLICFNTKGQCKIWVNQTLSINQIQFQGLNLKEIDVIDSLLTTVQQRIIPSSQLDEYYQIKNKHNFIGFKEALIFLNLFQNQNLLAKKTTNNQRYCRNIIQNKSYTNNKTQINLKKSLSVHKVNKQNISAIEYYSAKKNNQQSLIQKQQNQNYQNQASLTFSKISFKTRLPKEQYRLRLNFSTNKQNSNKVNFKVQSFKNNLNLTSSNNLRKQTLKKDSINFNCMKEIKYLDESTKPSTTISNRNMSPKRLNTQHVNEFNLYKKISLARVYSPLKFIKRTKYNN